MKRRDRPAAYSLKQIVEQIGGELLGDGNVRITQVAPLDTAKPDHLSFFIHGKYRRQLQTTAAGAVIVGEAERDATPLPRIVSANPYAYFAKASALLNPQSPELPAGVHPSAVVDASATVAGSARVGAHVWIGRNVRIGERATIYPNCCIGDDAVVGDDTVVYPNVTIYRECEIGRRVIVHAGAVIGADGFGLALEQGKWLKIPQVGAVIIGDDVEIGANTTIDRGALEDTVIEEGVKLDNQIQVAHNVRIGAHTAMAGCVGVAGSAKIGRHCTVGGASVILGHLEIADCVNVSAGTLVTKSIAASGTYTSAMPFSTHEAWLKNAAHLRHLDAMAQRIKQLEARLQALERDES
jgi:UDP-3-O-[3-hydroxymyristoyl] glucosamine N-acyltransferase